MDIIPRCASQLTKEQAEELSELLHMERPQDQPSQDDEQNSLEVAGVILSLEG